MLKTKQDHDIVVVIIIITKKFIYIASISLTVLVALQYHEKCINHAYKHKKLDTNVVINLNKSLVKYTYVFKCFLKEFKESAFLKDAGSLFHNLGPAIKNDDKVIEEILLN